jgi:hypothetical protein
MTGYYDIAAFIDTDAQAKAQSIRLCDAADITPAHCLKIVGVTFHVKDCAWGTFLATLRETLDRYEAERVKP